MSDNNDDENESESKEPPVAAGEIFLEPEEVDLSIEKKGGNDILRLSSPESMNIVVFLGENGVDRVHGLLESFEADG